MRKLFFILAMLTVAIASASRPCQAQVGDYVSIHSGWALLDQYNGMQEQPPAPPPPPPPIARTGTFKDGFNLGGAIGWYCSEDWRAELEFTYRNNRGDWWSAGPVGSSPTTQDWNGKINNYAGMVNLYRELGAFSLCEYITPYVGGGLGVAVQDGQLSTATTNYRFDEAAFAFQGMVGVDAQLCERLTFFSEYRFFGNTETSLENADIAPPMEEEIGRFNYSANNVLFGLRVSY